MTEREEPPTQSYLVEQVRGGFYVTNVQTGDKLFGTEAGGLFLVSGPSFIFTEAAEIRDPDTKAFYIGLVESADL